MKETDNKNITVAVAMSGGVDSSVAASLMVKEGFNVIGLTSKTFGYDDIPVNDSGCCSLETIYRAKNVADQLGFPHYTLDFTKQFYDVVIGNFISEYMDGRTPNPCVLCNKKIKWGVLLEKAISLGADFLVTGHYSKIKNKDGKYFTSKAKDSNKDQTYFLWAVSQEALSKTKFPLVDFTKPEIRAIAAELGLKSAETPDSQEICFVPDNDYKKLIDIKLPEVKENLSGGEVIYKGKKVGTHRGYPFYTIGQRKGLNLAMGKPVYVSKIDAKNNVIEIDDEDGLYSTEFFVKEINLQMFDKIESAMEADVKVRYKDPGTPAIIEQTAEDRIKVILKNPKKSVTSGQSAVFYLGEDVIGGGVIE